MTQALVLGGGGLARIVGTSASSAVRTQLTSGLGPEELYARQVEPGL